MGGLRSGDSDGRGRILRAALRRFAADGYERASLRAIAQEAQASVTLITYHFGSKQRLLDAADDWLRSLFERAAATADTRSHASSCTMKLDAFAASIGSLMAAQADVRAYLRRMVVVDQTPNGTHLLQSLVTLARDLAVDSPPPPGEPPWSDRALRFLLLALGPTLIGPALQRCVPDVFGPPAANASSARRIEVSGAEEGADAGPVSNCKPRTPRLRK